MKRSSLASAAVLGLCVGGGVALAGVYLGLSLRESRKPLRVVSVRGLAEREVDADLAVWPITFAEMSNDLVALNASLTEKRRSITEFLGSLGADFRRDEAAGSYAVTCRLTFVSRPEANAIELHIGRETISYDLEGYRADASRRGVHRRFLAFIGLRYGLTLRTRYR